MHLLHLIIVSRFSVFPSSHQRLYLVLTHNYLNVKEEDSCDFSLALCCSGLMYDVVRVRIIFTLVGHRDFIASICQPIMDPN